LRQIASKTVPRLPRAHTFSFTFPCAESLHCSEWVRSRYINRSDYAYPLPVYERFCFSPPLVSLFMNTSSESQRKKRSANATRPTNDDRAATLARNGILVDSKRAQLDKALIITIEKDLVIDGNIQAQCKAHTTITSSTPSANPKRVDILKGAEDAVLTHAQIFSVEGNQYGVPEPLYIQEKRLELEFARQQAAEKAAKSRV